MKCFGIVCLLFVVLVSLLGNANAECEYEGRKLQTGEKFQGDYCVLYTCKEDGELAENTCAIAALLPGCKIIPADYSKPYPKCCERYEC